MRVTPISFQKTPCAWGLHTSSDLNRATRNAFDKDSVIAAHRIPFIIAQNSLHETLEFKR